MPTQTLFSTAECEAMIARIQRLRPDTRPGWGKMGVAQMLAHCQVPLRVATGEVKLRRGLIGFLFGGLAKKQLMGAEGFKRNLPTDKAFVVRDARDFAQEKERLVTLVRRFGQGGEAGLTREPHPFFGAMSTAEWEALMWKHLDHHLGQFGV